MTQANPSILNTLWITVVSCPRSNNRQHCSLERDKRGLDPRPVDSVEYLGSKTTQIPQGQRSTTRKKWCRTLSCSRWYQHNVTQDTRIRWSCSLYAELVPHTPWTRLPQRSVRLGTPILVSHRLFLLPAAFPTARICRFQVRLAHTPQLFRAHASMAP